MNAGRLLAVAEVLCGAHARDTVFEPLVADWQREAIAARGAGDRVRIASRGGLAFATSLALRIDTRETVQRHARAIGWAALPVFTLLGAVLYVQPITIDRPWLWPPVVEMAPLSVLVWYIPMMAAYGLVFAIVPVCLAFAASETGVRRTASAGALVIAAFVAIEGWAVPGMVEMRLRHQFGERVLDSNRFVRMTIGDSIRQSVESNPRIAARARATLVEKSRKPMLMIALGLIGAALGRSRALARRAIGVRTLIGYWLFGWGAVASLGLLAGLLGYYPALRPYAPGTWFPPFALLVVGISVWLVPYRQNPEPRLPRTK